MDLNINIQTNDNCSVVIQDITEYLPEESTGTVKSKFKYSDTVSIDILQYNKIQDPYYSVPVYTKHSDKNHYTKISIKDEGEGISKEDLKHVFERFYKGKNSSENSVGIGLALSKSIIEKNNGMITCRSEVGKGTEFVIKYMK